MRNLMFVILAAVLTVLILPVSSSYAEGSQESCSDWAVWLGQSDRANDFSTNEEIKEAEKRIYSEYLAGIQSRKNELTSGSITVSGFSMQVSMEIIGEPDVNGYPMYIALRGGGTDSKELADEQFEAMKNYYKGSVTSGIYVVPYGVRASYDEHYRPESFLFYDRIIEDAVAFYNADPNRIYLVGFSSGGDGVYAIAPRMADRFAAVNISAGCPHTANLGNFYNLPICLQAGEKDDSCDRNALTAKYGLWLNAEAEKYGGGFIHNTYIHINGDHNSLKDNSSQTQQVIPEEDLALWLEHPEQNGSVYRNTNAIDWVSRYTRDPLPEKIVWETSVHAGLRNPQAFYWLDRNELLGEAKIIASRDPDSDSITIEISGKLDGKLKIYLKPEMTDVFSDITLRMCNRTMSVHPIVSEMVMRKTMNDRGDPNYMFTSEIEIYFNSQGKIITITPLYDPEMYHQKINLSSLLYWDDNGLFYADESLFGLSFEELKNKTGLLLTEPVSRTSWGNRLFRTSWIPEEGREVVFMFQDGKTVIIYAEQEGKITDPLIGKLWERFPEIRLGIDAGTVSACGGLCHYKMDNDFFDGTDHIRQMYTSYLYQE